MNKEILIGSISGLAIATTIMIWRSDNFTYLQKILLSICFPLPPAQWLLAIFMYLFNRSNFSNLRLKTHSFTEISNSQYEPTQSNISLEDQKQSLNMLKKQGVLSDFEFKEKTINLDNQKAVKEIQELQEYIELAKLYKSDLLSKEQFDTKINELIANHKEYYSRYGDDLLPKFTWDLYQSLKTNKMIEVVDYH